MPVRKSEKSGETSPDTIQKFRKLFPSVGAPEGGSPRIPTKISAITSDNLGDLLSKYSAWREFCEDIHLVAYAELMQVKEAYEMKRNELLAVTIGETVTDKKAIVDSTPAMQKLGQKYLEKDMYATMLSKKLESYGNTLTILSRELTRRGILV